LSGDTNVRYLKENNVNIWDSWVDPDTAIYRSRSIDKVMKDLIDKGLGESVLDELRVALVDDIIRLIFGDLQDAKDIGPRLNAFVINVNQHRDLSIVSGVHAIILQIAKDNNIEVSELVEGGLPNIYNKQWRRWEHTTQILEDDLPKYEALGYEVVGKGGKVDGVHSDDVLFVHREIDQIQRMVEQLKKDPDSRRIILSPWNVGELELMALPACHCFFQLWTRKLSIEERIEIAKAKGRNIDFMRYLEDGDPSGENALNGVLTAWEIPERELSSQLYMR
jgi:thymidylate synthase